MTEETPRANMQEIVMQKDRLVAALQENKGKHKAAFDEAITAYHTRCVEILQGHIDRIKKGSVERVSVTLPVPEDHTDDYDKAIANLEWSIYETVELNAHEFDAYVRDNWSWKREFVATSQAYTSR